MTTNEKLTAYNQCINRIRGIIAGTEMNWCPLNRPYTKRELKRAINTTFEQWCANIEAMDRRLAELNIES